MSCLMSFNFPRLDFFHMYEQQKLVLNYIGTEIWTKNLSFEQKIWVWKNQSKGVLDIEKPEGSYFFEALHM